MNVIYRIRLLGTIQLEKAGQPIKIQSRKALALLGYLASQDQPVSRSHLAGLFWPDKTESRGRGNLSRELSQLSVHLPGCFEANYHTVQFKPEANSWLDTRAFTESVSQGGPLFDLSGLDWGEDQTVNSQAISAIQPTKLAEAVALYRGDFMAGYYLDGCPEFESWLVREQEAWQQRVIEVLEGLFVYHTLHRRDDQAQLYVKHWLALCPWQEKAHRYLMLLLARNGQRSAALIQYETCRRVLAEELGVEPSVETVVLSEQIRRGEGAHERTISSPSPFADWLVRQAAALLPPCPYRGLSAFTEVDAPFFFGREAFIDRLFEAVHRQPLVAVIGPSGSGKSSVAFAGLLPRLRKDEGGRIKDESGASSFVIVTFRPGGQVFQALAAALIPLLELRLTETEQLIESRRLAETLHQGRLLLSDVVTRIVDKSPQANRLLLVIDQFEEIYTLCPEPGTCQRFIDTLLSVNSEQLSVNSEQRLTADYRSLITVVLTLRTDFIGQVLAHRPLADALQDGTMILGPMTRQELRQAIEEPAKRQGVTFEAGLVERLLEDVGSQPGHLPLLEFALTTLWQQWTETGGPLTHTAYEAIGGVEGALAQYADRVYTELSKTEQEQARRIFVQLVHPGRRTEDMRRLTTRAELGEDSWPLVQHLADARLVVTNRVPTGQETVEIVHEALIQSWGRLQTWLNENRAFRIWQERLRMALEQWELNNWDEGVLLRGALLVEAEAWLQSRANELSPQELLFLDASITLRNQELLAAKAQRQRELAQAQALAEAEHQRAELQARANWRLRWLVAALVVMFLLFCIATTVIRY